MPVPLALARCLAVRSLSIALALGWACAAAQAALAAPAAAPAPEEEAAEAQPSLAERQLDQVLEEGEDPAPAAPRLYRPEDLEPYFASGPLAAAKRLFDQRRYRRARAALRDVGDDPHVRYLAALASYRQGDHATAAGEFSALADRYPALRDLCLLYAGKASEALGARARAAEHYAKVGERSGAFAEARFGLGRVVQRRGDLEGAIDALAPLREQAAVRVKLATWAKGDALLKIAELARHKGDHNAAHRALLEAWATSPFSSHARVAWDRLQGLPVPNKWRIRRAEVLLGLHHNLEAARLAKQVKSPLPDEWACRAGLVAGTALRKERQHRQAIAVLSPVAKRCPAVRLPALLTMAYSQSVVDPPAGAATYDVVAAEFAGQRHARNAAFLAAQIDLRRGDLPAALARLERISSGAAAGEHVPEALFRQALIRRELGHRRRAVEDLERLLALPDAPSGEVRRARYWRARLLEELYDPAAREALARVAAEHPATYYGLLARSRLGPEAAGPATTGGKPCSAADKWPLDAGPLGADPRFIEGVELLRLGLRGGTAPLLSINPRDLPAPAAELLIEVLRRAGEGSAASRVTRLTLGRDLDGPIDLCAAETWQALYPRPFLSTIQRAAAVARIEPELLLALIREESRFRPSARSSTGALGLTQLMPATAAQVARDFKLGKLSQDDLFRPSVNVAVGGRYLGSLVARFQPSLGQAVAAYNAGPTAVSRWDRRPREGAELDEWVEWIPFDETRDYVKRVLGSYGAYQLLYREDAAPVVALRLQ